VDAGARFAPVVEFASLADVFEPAGVTNYYIHDESPDASGQVPVSMNFLGGLCFTNCSGE
jgi:hypothetical protein